FVLEFSNVKKIPKEMTILGKTTSKYVVLSDVDRFAINLENVKENYEGKMEKLFPYHTTKVENEYPLSKARFKSAKADRISSPVKYVSPRVLIPVFPGTNCEYDTAKAFEKAGAKADIFVINTLTNDTVTQSVNAFAKMLDNSQILMLPGGFSGGDEPDGSGKFICAFLKNPQIREAIDRLLKQRDGLALGICNGFQALIKLGLVPFGEVTDITETAPTLTFNTINRHQSMMVSTRICSNKSPW
ncbi:MAG: phosphoribosylformylglycinamidine synthase subunit PurQ, partial [Oscillospiraceae bacterium]